MSIIGIIMCGIAGGMGGYFGGYPGLLAVVLAQVGMGILLLK